MAINLKQLTALFAQSAGNIELPRPIQEFAAQLAVLTAHVARVGAKGQALEAKLDEQIAELATHLMAVRPTATAAAVPAPENTQTNDAPIGDDEEDQAKAMAEQVQRETEAEVAAIANAPAITPIRKSNAGKISVEEAS